MILFNNQNTKLTTHQKKMFDNVGVNLAKLTEIALENNENKELNNLVEFYKTKIINLEKEILKLQQNKYKIKESLKNEVTNIKNLKSDEDELKKVKLALQKSQDEIKQNELKQNELNKMHKNLKNVNSEINFLKNEYKNNLKIYQNKQKELQDELTKSIATFAKLQKAYDTIKTNLEEIIKELRLQNNELLQKNNKLELQNKQLKDTNNQLTDTDKELSNNNKKLSDNNNQLTEDNKQLTEDNKQLTEDNKQLTEDNKQLTNTIKQLTDTNNQLTDTNNQVTDTNKRLTDTNNHLSDANNQLIDINRELQETIYFIDKVIDN